MQVSKSMSRLVLAALMAAFVLSACNTVAGAGKDVEKAGEEVQDAANEAR